MAENIRDLSHKIACTDLWISIENGKPLHLGCGGLINVYTMADTGRRFLKCQACGQEVYSTVLVTFMGCGGVVH